MTTYLYLSDIHGNFEALKHLKNLPEMSDPNCQIRFGGDYIDGFDLQPNAIIQTNGKLNPLFLNGVHYNYNKGTLTKTRLNQSTLNNYTPHKDVRFIDFPNKLI